MNWVMASFAYAVAATVTLAGFWPGAGLCSQTPLTEPFRLLYPYPSFGPPGAQAAAAVVPGAPPDPEPDPPPDPVLLVFEGEPPHPTMTKTWIANANEQKIERKDRNIRGPRLAEYDAACPASFCFNQAAKFSDPRFAIRIGRRRSRLLLKH